MKPTPYDAPVQELEDTLAKLKALYEQKIAPFVAEIERFNRIRAHLLCPFAVGDTVTNRSGRKVLVYEIGFSDWGDGWKASGHVLRKDGTPGRMKYLTHYAGWRKQDPTPASSPDQTPSGGRTA